MNKLLIAIALVGCSLAAFLIGDRVGTRKGAHIAAAFAVQNLESRKDFMLILGAIEPPRSKEIRDLMINFLESYKLQRAVFEFEPFSVPRRSTAIDDERIDELIKKLKHENGAEPAATDNAV